MAVVSTIDWMINVVMLALITDFWSWTAISNRDNVLLTMIKLYEVSESGDKFFEVVLFINVVLLCQLSSYTSSTYSCLHFSIFTK